MLHLYREALALRRRIPALSSDRFRWLPTEPGVLAFTRGDGFACVVNCSPRPVCAPPGHGSCSPATPRSGEKLPPNSAAWFLAGGRRDELTSARPLLLGYIRADVLRNGTGLPQAEAQLEAFAEREEFSLGTVYVERGDAPGAFEALMAEITRDEAAWGVVVPDLRHLTVVEQLILSRHEEGASTAILAASFTPRTGGPGVGSPTRARSCLSTAPRPRPVTP